MSAGPFKISPCEGVTLIKIKLQKLCPFRGMGFEEECIQERCALYVKIYRRTDNPRLYKKIHFEGCGLIQRIPWDVEAITKDDLTEEELNDIDK